MGYLDDKTMVGSLKFMETLELAVEMRESSYAEPGGRLGFDICPYTKEGVSAVRRSVEQWRFTNGWPRRSIPPNCGGHAPLTTRYGHTSWSTPR